MIDDQKEWAVHPVGVERIQVIGKELSGGHMSKEESYAAWAEATESRNGVVVPEGEPADDPYEIIITAQDQPQRSGYFSGNKHTQPMTYVRMNLPERHIRRIDRAAASINVNRQDIVRAIIRQALDSGPAEIVTGWGRSERV